MRLDPLHILPFASAALWALAGLASLPRDRPRTPTDLAFFSFTALLALWAFLDGVILQTSDPGGALTLVRLRDATASVGGLCLLCFAKWSTRGRTPTDLVLVAPVLGAVALGWLGASDIAMESWGPRVIRNLPPFAAWFLQSLVYVVIAFGFIGLGLRTLWKQDRPIAFRGLSVLVAAGIATVLALATNILIGFTGSTAPPPFSSLLTIPGASLLAAMVVGPIPRPQVARALRRMVLSFGRDFLGASVVGDDGAVFGIAMQEPRDPQQFDLPEVMVMIQQFLRAPPTGPPPARAEVALGEVRFLLRRGSGMNLIVAVRGQDHDFLDAVVDETFARLSDTPGLLAAARAGHVPSMGRIQGILRDLVATPRRAAGESR